MTYILFSYTACGSSVMDNIRGTRSLAVRLGVWGCGICCCLYSCTYVTDGWIDGMGWDEMDGMDGMGSEALCLLACWV